MGEAVQVGVLAASKPPASFKPEKVFIFVYVWLCLWLWLWQVVHFATQFREYFAGLLPVRQGTEPSGGNSTYLVAQDCLWPGCVASLVEKVFPCPSTCSDSPASPVYLCTDVFVRFVIKQQSQCPVTQHSLHW